MNFLADGMHRMRNESSAASKAAELLRRLRMCEAFLPLRRAQTTNLVFVYAIISSTLFRQSARVTRIRVPLFAIVSITQCTSNVTAKCRRSHYRNALGTA